IGDGCRIEGYCDLGAPAPSADGRPLVIGPGGHIRSHSIFYAGSTIGDRMQTGHRVTIRENTVTGTNPQFGSLADIQGDCEIGDFFRSHSGVFIGKTSRVGNYVWLFPRATLVEDPTPPSLVARGPSLGDYAAICANATVLPGVNVGAEAVVAAG